MSEARPPASESTPRPGAEERITRLLPIACLAAAAVLFASELMTMFEFTPPGGEPLDEQSAGERHGNAIFVIALFAIGALGLAIFTASKPAAIAVGAMGAIALLLFLLVDLPDAGRIGTLDDPRGSFFDAEAVPQEGFWMMMISALALAVTGAALATLSPEQLSGFRTGRRDPDRRPHGRPGEPRQAEAPASTSAGAAEASAAPHERALRRIRTRQRG